ncbi:protein FAR1-RELATED SEQUENCE 1-like [Olea europaea var. sylvestris]|uniref:protein FAR1-RELATED SEQUENCE 1-like n=1 Tax=Olea europaea var. sylvestris TaxID=158386 RepID=UPI000C1D2C20|nr:protein FAR1-RELATED SEQUENCE 1-like [Olea europaea var. sylvestris]
MVPCATKYGMEKQFQVVYAISKFRGFQDEITEKVYCDVISVVDICSEKLYEIEEDVIYEKHVRKKKFAVTFRTENCNVIYSCHLFEFRGILCRHAILVLMVLMRNGITSLPERYILRRWRWDVNRAHMMVTVNYAGLVRTPSQLRYDRMCEVFTTLADIAADDEE